MGHFSVDIEIIREQVFHRAGGGEVRGEGDKGRREEGGGKN